MPHRLINCMTVRSDRKVRAMFPPTEKQTAPAVSRQGRAKQMQCRLFRCDVNVGTRTLDQFHIGHRRRVTHAHTTLEDTQVATLALAIARSKLDEQLADRNLVAQAREREVRLATPSTLASVISGSATRRNSLALGSVVRISSCLNSDAAMFLNIASRWLLVRLSLRPDFMWRINNSQDTFVLFLLLAANELASIHLHTVLQAGWRPVFQLGAKRQATRTEHVLDFGQRLLAQIRRLQQFDFGALD